MTEYHGARTAVLVQLPLDLAAALEAAGASDEWSDIDSVVIAALNVLLLGQERPASRVSVRVSAMHVDLTHAIHSLHDTVEQRYAQMANHLDQLTRDLAEIRQRREPPEVSPCDHAT